MLNVLQIKTRHFYLIKATKQLRVIKIEHINTISKIRWSLCIGSKYTDEKQVNTLELSCKYTTYQLQLWHALCPAHFTATLKSMELLIHPNAQSRYIFELPLRICLLKDTSQKVDLGALLLLLTLVVNIAGFRDNCLICFPLLIYADHDRRFLCNF